MLFYFTKYIYGFKARAYSMKPTQDAPHMRFFFTQAKLPNLPNFSNFTANFA